MFYDWLVTHHGRLLETLHFGFADRLFREGYSLPETGNYLVENVTGLSWYPHDFRGLPEKDRPLIDSQIESVREKYVRRARRTREVLASGGEVRIVRHFFEEPVDKIPQQQAEIVARLSSLFPNTEFSYLWGSDFETNEINSPFGAVHHLPKAATWQGDDGAWDKAVSSLDDSIKEAP